MTTYTGIRLTELMDVVSDEFRGNREVPVIAFPGWETRGTISGTAWRFDIKALMNHDTGSQTGSSFDNVLRWIAVNSPIAPLAQIATSSPWAPDTPGKCHVVVVASGKANHAGAGKWRDVLTNSSNTISSVGNWKSLGMEHFWTPAHTAKGGVHPLHREVQLRLNACLAKHFNLTASQTCDHTEYAPTRKVDRRYINDFDLWREELRDFMAPPPPLPPEDEVTPEDFQRITEIVQTTVQRALDDRIEATAIRAAQHTLTLLKITENAHALGYKLFSTPYLRYGRPTGETAIPVSAFWAWNERMTRELVTNGLDVSEDTIDQIAQESADKTVKEFIEGLSKAGDQ